MRWLLLASLGLISGCGANATPPSPCSKKLQQPPPPAVLLTLVGEAITVPIDFPLVVACAGGNPIATSAETQVLDARLQPVAHDATAPTSSDTQGYSTRVTFTPASPGLYSLSARFEPGLGVARREVLVLADRTTDVPAAVFTPVEACDALSELPPYVLCERSDAAALDVYADGGRVTTLPAALVSMAPGAAWTLAGDAVTRWVSGEGGLEGEVLMGIDAGAVGLSHHAEDDALRLVSGTDFLLVRWGDAGLAVGDARVLPVAASGRSGLLVLDGGAALAFDAVTDGGTLGADAGAPLEDGGRAAPPEIRRVCRVDLSGADGGTGCTPLLLELGARQGDALWLRASDSRRVGLLRYLGGTGAPGVVFLPAQPFALKDQGKPLPYFTWNTYTVVLRPEDLLLEAFKPPVGRVKTGASPTHVWFVTADGQVSLHRR
ncbi:MAG: hypothetical protein AB1730_01530 [Myxococcota bacterium]